MHAQPRTALLTHQARLARSCSLALGLLLASTATWAAPAPKGAPRPKPRQVAPAEADAEGGRPRPSLYLVVEGSPEAAVIWRGWPVIIQMVGPSGAPKPQALEMHGPTPLTPSRSVDAGTSGKEALWVISAEASSRLAAGSYRCVSGPAEVEARVVNPPPSLTPEQVRAQRRLSVFAALALGDVATARRVATEWTLAEDASVDAFAALGDALAAAGDRKAAARAYCNAINRVPAGMHPPEHLHQRAREMLFGEGAPPGSQAPGTAPAPPQR